MNGHPRRESSTNPFPLEQDVHIRVSTQAMTQYLNAIPKDEIICFRCGEHGHIRSQCLTYKVRLCWHARQGYQCNPEQCTFAHGENELRQPWNARCVRVVKQGKDFVCLGCNSMEHTFRKCPLYKDSLLTLR